MALDPSLITNMMARWQAPAPVQLASPLQQYATLQALRQGITQQQLEQQKLQSGALELQETQRQIAGRDALNDAIRANTTINPNTNLPEVNHGAVATALGAAGHGDLIPGYMDGVTKRAEADAALQKTQNENRASNLDFITRAFDGANDQASWDRALAAVHGLGGNTANLNIPAVYSPEAKAQIMNFALSHKDKLETDAKTLEAQTKDRELKLNQEKERVATVKDSLNAAGAAQSQDQLDAARKAAIAAGATRPEMAQLPWVYSPAAMQTYNASRQTPAERQQAADRAAERQATENWRQQQQANEKARLGLEQAREARENKIYDQTYGEGSNEALRGVDPKLRVQATGAAQKAADAYNKAMAAQRDMQAFIDAARSGNKEAYAYMSPEGVLTLNTGRGVTRVNRQEIEAYKGAGSILDRLQGGLGKMVSGKDISDSVINDIEKLHGTISDNAVANYNQSLDSINQNYHANFKPVQSAAPPPPPPPVPHSNGKPAVGKYIVGGLYGPNKDQIYLGGDPNDGANWRKQ